MNFDPGLRIGLSPFENPRSALKMTTKKHGDFVTEPMGNKPVTKLAGIGAVLGERLKQKGFAEARSVFGKFLVLDDEAKFKQWLGETCFANPKQQTDCYVCLNEWSKAFM